MKNYLKIISGITFASVVIGAIITGVVWESFGVFFVSLIGGILVAFIAVCQHLAIAEVLENQERILFRLQAIEKNIKTAQKQCINCKRIVTTDYSSCPQCGGRMFR